MPARPASSSTASVKDRWSICWMKEITSPPVPQPKQWNRFLDGVTWKDGDFSSWNGQRPFQVDLPAALPHRHLAGTAAGGALGFLRPASGQLAPCLGVSPLAAVDR